MSKIHDLPEIDDLTLFLILEALKNKLLTFGDQLGNQCQFNELNGTSVS